MNTLIAFALYLFAAFGLSYIVGHSKITMPLRDRLARYAFGEDGKATPTGLRRVVGFAIDLIECYACSGFWWGVGFAVVAPSVAQRFSGVGYAFTIALCALATCGSNFFIALLSGAMMTKKEASTDAHMERVIERVVPALLALAQQAGVDISATINKSETKQ